MGRVARRVFSALANDIRRGGDGGEREIGGE